MKPNEYTIIDLLSPTVKILGSCQYDSKMGSLKNVRLYPRGFELERNPGRRCVECVKFVEGRRVRKGETIHSIHNLYGIVGKCTLSSLSVGAFDSCNSWQDDRG